MTFVDESLRHGGRVDHVSGGFKAFNEAVGDSHLSGEDDARRPFAPFPLLAEPRLVFGHGIEVQLILLRRVVEERRGCERRVPRYGREELFAVNEAAHVAQHVAVISVAAGEVLLQVFIVHGIDGVYLVVGIRCGRGKDGRPGVGRFREGLPLLVGDAQAHAVDQHHVVFPCLMEFFGREFLYLDKAVVVGF